MCSCLRIVNRAERHLTLKTFISSHYSQAEVLIVDPFIATRGENPSIGGPTDRRTGRQADLRRLHSPQPSSLSGFRCLLLLFVSAQSSKNDVPRCRMQRGSQTFVRWFSMSRSTSRCPMHDGDSSPFVRFNGSRYTFIHPGEPKPSMGRGGGVGWGVLDIRMAVGWI